jgi:predicted metal-dependent enzyme (double-stranded beta helix superfamily)
MPEISRRSLITSAAGALVAGSCATPSGRRKSPTSVAFDRDQFIEDVKRAVGEGQGAVEEVIARAVSDPGSVIRALGEPKSASIELLHRDQGLSIFKIVWPPLTVLVPHDHLMWASIGVYTGREDNIMWKPSGETIRAAHAASVAATEVFSLPPEAVHSVTNPVEGYTAAIHVYGGDLPAAQRSQWDPLTLSRGPFDVEDGRRILQQADARSGSSS